MAEVVALATITGSDINDAYNQSTDLFHTTWASTALIAVLYLMVGMAYAWPKQVQREEERQRLILQQEYYQKVKSLQEMGLIEI